jgi:hypothetical protein
MRRRSYRVQHFKFIDETNKWQVYGAKTFVGTLDRAIKRLLKMYGPHAAVRTLGPGWYDVAEGRAELRVLP